MPQYLIIAYDRQTPDQLERRKALRPEHLPRIREMARNGELITGGGMLNETGQVIGSAGIYEFADQAALDKYLAEEAYNKGGLWERVEVRPFFTAFVDGKEAPFPDTLLGGPKA